VFNFLTSNGLAEKMKAQTAGVGRAEAFGVKIGSRLFWPSIISDDFLYRKPGVLRIKIHIFKKGRSPTKRSLEPMRSPERATAT
jgi:hypothetical protein